MDYIYNLFDIKKQIITQTQKCQCHINTASKIEIGKSNTYRIIEIDNTQYSIMPCKDHINYFK